MAVERELILSKLTGFLTGEISKTEIYEWALFVVVASDYEKLIKGNNLTQEIFQFLIDIDKPRTMTVPTKKVLEYFISCLEGKKEFTSENYKALMDVKSASTALTSAKLDSPVNKPAASLGWLVAFARVYVLTFLAGLILLNFVAVIKPDFLVRPSEIAPSAREVGREASPHLLYGILILLAMSVKLPRIVFCGFIPVGIWGMFFYWSIATSVAFKNGLSLLNVAMLLAVVALPPTAAFFILLNRWFSGAPQQSKSEVKKQE